MDLVQTGAKIGDLCDEVSILRGTLDRMHQDLAKREPLVAVLLDKLSEARGLLRTAEIICGNISARHPGV